VRIGDHELHASQTTAHEAAQEGKPRGPVLDRYDIDPEDLAVQLKSRWPRVKVVLMSGYAEDEVLRRRIAAREVRYLQKPFGMEVLARELRAALEE
jgi:DNA-binding NarL/FixJ family response regulator